MSLLNYPSSLQPPSPFMLITFFYLKNFLLQLQCPLFNPTSILLHHGLALIILLSPTAITSERKCCYIKDEDKRFLLKTYPMTATLHPPTNSRIVVMTRQGGKNKIHRNIER